MNMEIWASRVHSAKHISAVQPNHVNSSDNYLNINDTEGDDDTRAYFPCPFCYVEIEVSVLCIHLQKEHCFDLKNAVCPLCAANLGKDIMGHFTMQHSQSVKRRRKSQKSGSWTYSSAVVGKDLRDLSSSLGSNFMNSRGNDHESAPDPLLSPFLWNVSLSDPKGNREDEYSTNAAPTTSDVKSIKACKVDDDVEEEDCEEKRQRAAFFQQLVMSTIF